VERLAAERQVREAAREFTVMEALGDTRVLLLAIVYFGVVAANYGLSFFLPQIIKAFGLTNVQTGFVNAIPFLVGLFAMIYWGRRSDRLTERKEHFALAALLIGFGVSATTLIDGSVGKMIAFSIAGFGIFAVLPVFWTLPTAFLSGSAAAAGIAIINSIGNLAGFAGPYVMGKIRDQTGSFTVGLLAITGLVALAALIALALPHETALEKPPEAQRQL
jgi:nitrate/nitrite transporter NarK